MSRPRNTERRPAIFPPGRVKTCPACGETKPWPHFYVLERHADDTVARVRSKCKVCESEIAQLRWQQRIADPEGHAAWNAERIAYHRHRMATEPEYVAERRRQARENRRLRYWTDPEYRRAEIEKSKRYSASPRGREVERLRRARARRERENETKNLLDLAPWTDWLRHQEWKFEGTTDFARWLGVDESMLRRWLKGEDTMSDVRADAVLTRVGEPYMLYVLWPELGGDTDQEEERRAA